jgi:hypothetical protein
MNGKTVLAKAGKNTWRVDNTYLKADADSLGYRKSKSMPDRDGRGALWDSRLHGTDCGDGWVKITVAEEVERHDRAMSMESGYGANPQDSWCLPLDYALGDTVFYSGDTLHMKTGDQINFGANGKVVGPGPDIRRVAVAFDGQKNAIVLMLDWLTSEDPLLPGGLYIGDRVYWQGGKQRFASGNMVVHGVQGKLVGRGSQEKRLFVLFDGNETPMEITMNQVSIDVPVIPGGYDAGEDIYYCGELEKFSNGDTLENGLKGEVLGRSTTGNDMDEKRVKVLFDGHTSGICVLLSQVMRDYPVIPGGFEISQMVTYVGDSNKTFKNGDKLEAGMSGKVSGRSTIGDGLDEERVKLRLIGNKGSVAVNICELEPNKGGKLGGS